MLPQKKYVFGLYAQGNCLKLLNINLFFNFLILMKPIKNGIDGQQVHTGVVQPSATLLPWSIKPESVTA